MELTPATKPEMESTTVKLSSVFCGLAVLALGFGVQLAQGFFQTKVWRRFWGLLFYPLSQSRAPEFR